MSRDLRIIPLSREKQSILRFLRVSYRIYRNDPNWVAPLLMDLAKVFSDANPLFDHAEMQLWVAERDGQDVGRVAAIMDSHYRDDRGRKMAYFGFFECERDPETTRRLFQEVQGWCRNRGAAGFLGPMNPTTNDECGLLVDGFNSPPVFMMTYNPPYYIELLEQEGFRPAKDLLAYYIDLSVLPMDRLSRIAEKVRKRNPDLTFRPVLKKTLAADLAKIKEVYNAAWEDNWGFVPMTDAEVDFMADRLKPLLMEGLVWLTECGDKPVGFLLATPDYNVPIQPLKGKLLSPAIISFLPYVLGWKHVPRTRVLTLGVIPGYRGKGLESTMLIEGLKVGIAAGVTESEASWILEENVLMRRVLESIGGRVYKTYRLYERAID